MLLQVEPPLDEAKVSADGSEVWAYLQRGIRILEVVDLRIFGGFRPGITPAEAIREFGEPTEIRASNDGTQYVFRRNGAVVVISETVEISSLDDRQIPRYQLRVLVDDPPFADGLPPSFRKLWTLEPRTRSVMLASHVDGDPTLFFELLKGRVVSVLIVPAPPKASIGAAAGSGG